MLVMECDEMNTGECLCGQVSFKVTQNIQVIYHCYCSLCRKQSGTGHNAASMVKADQFFWINGKQHITIYQKKTGFTSAFCQICGSPVPNQIGKTEWIWLPLGLLNQEIHPQQHLKFCMASKAGWVENLMSDQSYANLPDWSVLNDHFTIKD